MEREYGGEGKSHWSDNISTKGWRKYGRKCIGIWLKDIQPAGAAHREDLWHIHRKLGRRQWHPIPVLLPGKSHGRRSLVGYSPWGHKESDTTEGLHFHFSHIGEGTGNPLQCSCLENPRDGGAWWAAIYGVTQSQTQLRRLSSSRGLVGMDGDYQGK